LDQLDPKARFGFTVISPEGSEVISDATPDVIADPAGPGMARWHSPDSPQTCDAARPCPPRLNLVLLGWTCQKTGSVWLCSGSDRLG
jgi:hypothetical protein